MYTIEDIKLAYNKLRTYIYYDNTELLLRQKLVEFETDTKKDNNYVVWGISYPYNESEDELINIFKSDKQTVKSNLEIKFNRILQEINDYNEKSQFVKYLYASIDSSFFPKKIKPNENELNENFISNKKTDDKYSLEKITAFIDVPIEIHLFSVMWIIKNGYIFESQLMDVCKGNRLLLNKDKTALIQNSSLFKPYFSQYQQWRDESVSTAQELLKSNKNALFINLDIKDYYHSTRIDLDLYFPEDDNDSINTILRKVHLLYSLKLSKNYKLPKDFSKELDNKSILPIGLLSSYIIANHYLHDLDNIICKKYKPAYYGRYVDDILIVFAEPKDEINTKSRYKDYKFKFEKYEKQFLDLDVELGFKEKDLTTVEKYLLYNLSPLFKIVPAENNKRLIQIDKYHSLYCQPDKTLMYYFHADESDLVIDKLKQELNYKSSEFRDLPDDNENLGDFDKNAFYLNYTDSDGKIRTLKDYKENRYGLTVYLTNKILGAIKHKKNVDDDEISKLLKIFKGKNCIEFFKLWEKIFTFLMVNNKPKEYVDFYFHCVNEIHKIGKSEKVFFGTRVSYNRIQDSLIAYLDSAHEIVLSLHPNFINNDKKILKNFEYKSNLIESEYFYNEITRSKSIWVSRYRKTNMMRHHYVSIPLLNYTKESYEGKINLINYNFKIEKYTIDKYLIKNSPRPVKFWECSISQLFTNLKSTSSKISVGNLKTNIADWEVKGSKHFLDQAFKRFRLANRNHKSKDLFEDKINPYKNKFFEFSPSSSKEIITIKTDSNLINKLAKPKISVANTFVNEQNIIDALRNKPNVSKSRYQDLVDFLKSTRKNNSDIVIFPEFFIPIEILSSLVRYSEKNESLLISGLEHITVNNIAFNFVVTIMPINIDGYKDATLVFRLKNHYAPVEEDIIVGNHYLIPKPLYTRYHIFNWKNIYFSVFYCFELANIIHRSLIKNKIDLLIAVEYNKDVNYFSNLVESVSRDLHCYVAQVNSSHYGDTRISQPSETYRKDIVKLKGGENNVTVMGTIEIDKLREFQRKKYGLTKNDKTFKVLPPDFDPTYVTNRIKNK
ncbi:reverse transcriptase domain-containing protein [Flavobacterium gelatinilyticum]|uniref:reverse transcriptase domain-containing protein n=1 Tax=Flavobacterium gelatinilyticum TaxID=3003260 RepID=UPI0024815378|nr:reverse transcriptase domain-containing protein [Flavobacterium gelatinilyticum]